jgi:hypothetical protein
MIDQKDLRAVKVNRIGLKKYKRLVAVYTTYFGAGDSSGDDLSARGPIDIVDPQSIQLGDSATANRIDRHLPGMDSIPNGYFGTVWRPFNAAQIDGFRVDHLQQQY